MIVSNQGTLALRQKMLNTLKPFGFGFIVFIVPALALVISLYVREEVQAPHEIIVNRITTDSSCRDTLGVFLETLELLAAAQRSVPAETTEAHVARLTKLMTEIAKSVPEIVGAAGWKHLSEGSQTRRELLFSHSVVRKTHESDSLQFEVIPYGRPHSLSLTQIPWNPDVCLAVSVTLPLKSGFHAVHCWLQSKSSESLWPYPGGYCTLFMYAPMLGLGGYLANFIYVFCIFLILILFYRHRWVAKQRYFKTFRAGVATISVTYLLFLIPLIVARLLSIDLALRTELVTRVISYLLPDVPLFVLTGLYLLQKQDRRLPVRVWLPFLLLHWALNFPDARHHWLQISGTLSVLDTQSRFLREFWPQLYATISLLLVGSGLYVAGRRLIVLGKDTPPSLNNIVAFIFMIFMAWGGYQVMYFFRTDLAFFQMVFALKVIAISGFLLFTYLQSLIVGHRNQMAAVEEKAMNREKMLQGIGERSPDLIFCLDNKQKVDWSSENAAALLAIKGTNVAFAQLVYNKRDYDWLLESLIKPGIHCDDFEFTFRNKDGHRLICQASFVPGLRGTDPSHDLLIARPIELVFFYGLEREFDFHSLKNIVTNVEKLLSQLIYYLKDLLGVRLPKDDPRVVGIKRNLNILRNNLAVPEDPALTQANVSDLAATLDAISKQHSDTPRWSRLSISFPALQSPCLIRAKPKILREMIEELLDNANRKFDEDQKGTTSIQVNSQEPNKIQIRVQDSGKEFEEEELHFFKRRHKPKFPFTRIGLPAIDFYMRFFGGGLALRNESVNGQSEKPPRPTVVLEFWKTKGGRDEWIEAEP